MMTKMKKAILIGAVAMVGFSNAGSAMATGSGPAPKSEALYAAMLDKNWTTAEQLLTAKDDLDMFDKVNLAYIYRHTGRYDDARRLYNDILAMKTNPYADLGDRAPRRIKTIARAGLAALNRTIMSR